MILRSVCLAVLVTLAASAYGQPLQIRAGFNYSTLTGGDELFHGGFYAGIQKDFQIGKGKVFFEPGIFYSLQTFQYDLSKFAYSAPNSYVRHSMHYIQLPMLFNFRLREHFGILAGPQAGLLGHVKQKIQNGSTSTNNDAATSTFNSLAFSIAAGPYVQVNENFKIELRLLYDLMKTDNYDGHTMMAQLGFVYAFNKKDTE